MICGRGYLLRALIGAIPNNPAVVPNLSLTQFHSYIEVHNDHISKSLSNKTSKMNRKCKTLTLEVQSPKPANHRRCDGNSDGILFILFDQIVHFSNFSIVNTHKRGYLKQTHCTLDIVSLLCIHNRTA